MKKLKENLSGAAILRLQAEKLVKNKPLETGSQLLDAETLKLVHELQVQQIELELQNEELRLAKVEAEVASQKYTEIYDFAPSGFFTLSKEGKIVDLNLRGANMLGKQRPVLINSIFTFFVSDDTKSVFNFFLQKIFSKKTKQSCEVTFSLDDKLPVYVFIKGIISKNGERCIINVFDISKRILAEKALRKSEELNRSIILHTAMDGFWQMDVQGKILEVNETYCGMSGYSQQELLSMKLSELEACETDEDITTHIKKLIETGNDRFETIHRRKDGSIFYVEISTQYRPEEGKFVAFLRDISDRKRYEEDLIYHAGLIENVSDAIISTDVDFRIKSWNKSAEKIYGWKAVETIGKFVSEIVQNEYVNHTSKEEALRLLLDDGFWQGEVIQKRKDKTSVNIHASVKLLRDKYGKVIGSVAVNRDITELRKSEVVLRQRENQYRSFFLNNDAVILLIDPETAEIRNANPAACRYYGWSHSELCSKSVFEINLCSKEEIIINLQKTKKQKNNHLFLKHCLANGELRDVEVYSGPIQFEELVMVYAIIYDITEQNLAREEVLRTEKALKASEEKFALIYEKSPYAIAINNISDGRINDVNEAFENIFGFSKKEVIGKTSEELGISINSERREAIFEEIKKIGFVHDIEDVFFKKSGEACIIRYNIDIVETGNEKYFLITAEDITKHKKAAKLLIESELRYRTLFEESNDAIFLLDLESGRYTDCNPLAEKLTGYTREEILNLKNGSLLPPQRNKETVSNIEIIESHNLLRKETEVITRDGKIIPVEFNSSKIEINKMRFVLIMLHDISDRKAAEEALKQSEARVRFKLQSILSPEGSIADLELHDIIDVPSIQKLMDYFYELVQIPMAIIDLKGEVLVGVGWQDICTKFHRVHPMACRNCFESDVHLTRGIRDDEFMLYKCKNNMWDMATPLIIGGEHKGNLYLGQFFFNDESIEYQLFSKQAHQYGFNEQEYLAALDKVPRLSKHKLDNAKAFFLNLSRSISQVSYSNIKLARAITQQKKVEDELREKDDFLNKAQKMAQLGSWSLDLDKNILTWSEEMYRIFDMLPNEFHATYEGFLELVHPEDRDIVNSAYTNSIIEGKDSYEIEHRIFRKHSGELRYVLERCEHVRDSSGKIIRSVGMTHDITELKQSAEALMENERLLRESQAAAQIGSYYTDLIQNTWKATPAIYEIFGIDENYPHTLEGWVRCVHPDFREELTGEFFQKEKTNNIFEHEYKIIRVSDAAERWVYGFGKFEYDDQVNPVRLIGTIQDITKRKQAEEALKQLNEELENRIRERTEELINVTFEVEERERNRFSLELHDDLGPLLSTAKLYFQWLAETDIPEKKKIITEKGNISIDRAIQTTREISHGLGSQIVKNTGFSGAVQNFVRNINDTQKLYIDFKFNTYKRFCNFLEITLYRITTELINNTLKYANATRVEIDFDYNKERQIILFTYTDNGVGFDLEAVEKTNRGHGLVNIKHRINLISGEIRIETGFGKGMHVYIILPVDDEMNSNPAKNQEIQEFTVQLQNMNIV